MEVENTADAYIYMRLETQQFLINKVLILALSLVGKTATVFESRVGPCVDVGLKLSALW